MEVETGEDTSGRRRERHTGAPRTRRLYVTYTDTELEVVRTAARREGLAAAAWAGRQLMAVAQETLIPVSRDAGDVLRELIHARVLLRETLTTLRQPAEPTTPDDHALAPVVEEALRAIARVDEATCQVMRERRSRS